MGDHDRFDVAAQLAWDILALEVNETVKGRELKCFTRNEESIYLSAEECRALARAFSDMASRLDQDHSS